jgi:hypothetical protein
MAMMSPKLSARPWRNTEKKGRGRLKEVSM